MFLEKYINYREPCNPIFCMSRYDSLCHFMTNSSSSIYIYNFSICDVLTQFIIYENFDHGLREMRETSFVFLMIDTDQEAGRSFDTFIGSVF